MNWNRCKGKYCLSVVLIIFSLLFLLPEKSKAAEYLHQDGTIYCVCAGNLEMTTKEQEIFKEEGSLQENILKRSAPIIRILDSMTEYEGGMGRVDIEKFMNLTVEYGSVAVPVTMYVNAEASEEGWITIQVTVTFVEVEPEVPDGLDAPDTPDTSDVPDTPNQSVAAAMPKLYEAQDTPKPREEALLPVALTMPKISEFPAMTAEADRQKAWKTAEYAGKTTKAEMQTKKETETETISTVDAVLLVSCVASALVYGIVLIPDFRLIRWFNRRKQINMKKSNGG